MSEAKVRMEAMFNKLLAVRRHIWQLRQEGKWDEVRAIEPQFEVERHGYNNDVARAFKYAVEAEIGEDVQVPIIYGFGGKFKNVESTHYEFQGSFGWIWVPIAIGAGIMAFYLGRKALNLWAKREERIDRLYEAVPPEEKAELAKKLLEEEGEKPGFLESVTKTLKEMKTILIIGGVAVGGVILYPYIRPLLKRRP